MTLKDIAIPRVIDTSHYTFSTDFISPALSESVRYDRGVGFFTSGWIKNNFSGLIDFIENSGIARWVISPVLNDDDIKAMTRGTKAAQDPRLYDLLQTQADDLVETLSSDIMLALSWLVADQRLIFRIAIPTRKI
jgi:hypothetical protein